MTSRNLLRCVLSALAVGALIVPCLAQPATRAAAQTLEVEGTDQAQQRQRAVAQKVEVLFREHERAIRQAINDRQFDNARERVEMARRMVESARRELQPPERYSELTRQLDSLVRFIGSEERMSAARPPRVSPERGVKGPAPHDRQRSARIAHLYSRVMELRRQRQFEQAGDLLRDILADDPTEERARFLLDALENAGLTRKRLDDRREMIGQTAEALQEGESARVIDTAGREITYPSTASWRIIPDRATLGPAMTGGPGADRRTEHPRTDVDQTDHRLREMVPMIDFPEGTSFEEVLNWLRQRSGLSIHVNWNALAALGIDRTTDTLGITLASARFETILRLVLDNIAPPEIPLDYDIVDGIVRISTREHLDQYRSTRVYDVSDLLIRIPSFRSEDSGFGMGGAMGMGTGPGTMGGTRTGMIGVPGFGTGGEQPGLGR